MQTIFTTRDLRIAKTDFPPETRVITTMAVMLELMRLQEMSIRDEFAKAALTGIVMKSAMGRDEAAKSAYAYADEMIKARDKSQ